MVRPSAHPRWKSHREEQGRDDPHYPPAAREAPIAADKQPGHSLQQTGERRGEAEPTERCASYPGNHQRRAGERQPADEHHPRGTEQTADRGSRGHSRLRPLSG